MAVGDDAGQFDYHHIDERDVSIRVDGDTAVLTSRIITDATVYGTRARWRLLLTQHYTRTGGRWPAQRSVVTTW